MKENTNQNLPKILLFVLFLWSLLAKQTATLNTLFLFLAKEKQQYFSFSFLTKSLYLLNEQVLSLQSPSLAQSCLNTSQFASSYLKECVNLIFNSTMFKSLILHVNPCQIKFDILFAKPIFSSNFIQRITSTT